MTNNYDLTELIEQLSDEDDDVRTDAVSALVEIGEPAVPCVDRRIGKSDLGCL